jgi:hypothetical protein
MTHHEGFCTAPQTRLISFTDHCDYGSAVGKSKRWSIVHRRVGCQWQLHRASVWGLPEHLDESHIEKRDLSLYLCLVVLEVLLRLLIGCRKPPQVQTFSSILEAGLGLACFC